MTLIILAVPRIIVRSYSRHVREPTPCSYHNSLPPLPRPLHSPHRHSQQHRQRPPLIPLLQRHQPLLLRPDPSYPIKHHPRRSQERPRLLRPILPQRPRQRSQWRLPDQLEPFQRYIAAHQPDAAVRIRCCEDGDVEKL